MKNKSLFCVLVVMTLASSLLTGCASGFSAPKASLQIYQPRVLQLKAGQTVITAEGEYTPQKTEIWHSPASFEELETELINTAAALAQERARN